MKAFYLTVLAIAILTISCNQPENVTPVTSNHETEISTNERPLNATSERWEVEEEWYQYATLKAVIQGSDQEYWYYELPDDMFDHYGPNVCTRIWDGDFGSCSPSAAVDCTDDVIIRGKREPIRDIQY